MPTVNFVIKNKKNKGLILNDREVLTLYFYGIPIVNDQGTGLSSTTIETYIRRAQQELEKILTIKIVKQVIAEKSDYYRREYQGTGFVKTKFTVTTPFELKGFFGDQQQLEYPVEWLTANTVDGQGVNRQMLVVPNSNVNSIAINNALFAGSVIPYLGLVNSTSISNYWHSKYITGFGCDNLPYDLMEVIGKTASINIFNMLGDTTLGAGIASQSLSIDALSTSVSSTSSATSAGYGARIITYQKEIKESMKELRGIYKGISLASI